MAITRAYPNSAFAQRRQLQEAVKAKDAAAAGEAVQRLANMGATLSEARRHDVEDLIGPGRLASYQARFDGNAAPIGKSRVYATVSGEHALLLGPIWNSRARKLYLTSVVDRQIIDARTGQVVVAGDGASLLGGAYDPARDVVWAASGTLDWTPVGASRTNGLLSFDGRDRMVFPTPAGATLGDVAVAADGTVYASDGTGGAVYRCRPGCVALDVLSPPKTFSIASAVAVMANRVYVADFRYGLALIDPSTGVATRVAAAEDMMLDGIDSLIPFGGDLVAIQNGTLPIRIIRLKLADHGRRVDRLDVLERNSPDWRAIGLGAVVDQDLLYVADPQWYAFGKGGVRVDGRASNPTILRALWLH